MTNAMRHSGGSLVEIDLAVDLFERRLMVRIEDDGVGLRNAAGFGFGIQSMRQRAREVGSECTVGTVDSRRPGGCPTAAFRKEHPMTAQMPADSFGVLVADDHLLFRDGLRSLVLTMADARLGREAGVREEMSAGSDVDEVFEPGEVRGGRPGRTRGTPRRRSRR